MTAAVTIRRMMMRDLDAIMAIETASFAHAWTRPMFVQELEDRSMCKPSVAIDGARVVGYIVSWFLHDEVHVLNVAVDPSERRRGIGRALMEWVVKQARETSRELITLEVRPTNRAARRLYESIGFVAVALRRGYYVETGEDALVMVLRLDGEGARP